MQENTTGEIDTLPCFVPFPPCEPFVLFGPVLFCGWAVTWQRRGGVGAIKGVEEEGCAGVTKLSERSEMVSRGGLERLSVLWSPPSLPSWFCLDSGEGVELMVLGAVFDVRCPGVQRRKGWEINAPLTPPPTSPPPTSCDCFEKK